MRWKKNPDITIKELEIITHLTRRGVEYQVNKLKKAKIIKREGSDKNGYWIVLKPVSFKYEKSVENTVEMTVENTVEKILHAIQEQPHITIQQLANKTGLSRRGVEYNLQKLKSKHIIRRIGSDRNGYWLIIPEK